MGGITIGAMYFLGISGVTNNNEVYLDNIHYINIVVGCLLTYIIFYIFAGYLKGRIIKEKTIADVQIELKDKKILIKGLVDTGNFLTDPLTGKPVIIISLDAAREILPFDIAEMVENEENIHLMYEKLINSNYANRVRLIPYKSFGDSKGILIGIKPDKVLVGIHKDKKHNKFTTMPEGVILALYKGIFSGEGTLENYSVILHPSVMEGGIACNV